MTTPRITACQVRKCKHYLGAKGPPRDALFVCAAFPKGIPERILSGQDKHSRPVEGDGGIQFEKQSDE